MKINKNKRSRSLLDFWPEALILGQFQISPQGLIVTKFDLQPTGAEGREFVQMVQVT